MATYTELRSLFNDSDLLERVDTAIVKAANTIAQGTPTAAENTWIVSVLSNPRAAAEKALMIVLAENSSVSVAQIQGASDAALQTNVNSAVSVFVNALAGV